MKRILIPILAIFILAACSEKNNEKLNEKSIQKTEIMEKEEKNQIEKLLLVYQKSLNTSDAKLAQSLYTKDGGIYLFNPER